MSSLTKGQQSHTLSQVDDLEKKEARDTHLRSILKGLSWRIVASATTILIAYTITGDTTIAMQIGGIEAVLKILFFYLHERAWLALPRGTIRHIEEAVFSKKKFSSK